MKSSKIRVAVAEDCRDYREALAKCFEEDERFELVGTAEDGMGICTLARDKWPDVITMDIMMPTMDGIVATKNILSDNMIKRKPLIFMISNGTDFYQTEALENGAAYYLRKPVPPKVAVEKIYGLVPSYHRHNPDRVSESMLEYGAVVQDQDLESLVTEELLAWGLPITRIGFRYLKDAICMVIHYPYLVDRTVVAGIYKTISQKYQVSKESVERSMRSLLERYFPLASDSFLMEHYGKLVNNKKGRPTLSEFIAVLSEKLRVKQKKKLCKM